MEEPRPADDKAGESAVTDQTRTTSHAALLYTALRLAIFVVALLLLWLVRVRGLLLLALALLISGLASYALLGKQRDAMSIQLTAARDRRKQRAAARSAREDAIADELADDVDRDRTGHTEGTSSDLRGR